ncbi:YcgN family cysteine cluster protein [Teredinibacter turnerae]|uniref:YcgN family cysteine cluster protein n=1 Tax=Teredinibacter turnerae TaxID=2426 RepID=UPI000370FBF6|nr:YcgN family cysteine cluster protein [Teredinibacter turnerae]
MTDFWEMPLTELSPQQWEQLCDGCGKCCLHKLQDEETDELYFTDVACRYLNADACRCRDYQNRLQNQPDCLAITADNLELLSWLPSTCAYRLRSEGRPLPAWHPLISGTAERMHELGQSVRGRVVSESEVQPDDLEDHVVYWVEPEDDCDD